MENINTGNIYIYLGIYENELSTEEQWYKIQTVLNSFNVLQCYPTSSNIYFLLVLVKR